MMTLEKSALITEKINIQLDDVRKESRRRFYESEERNGKSVPNETEYQTIEKAGSVQSGNGRKAEPLSSMTQC